MQDRDKELRLRVALVRAKHKEIDEHLTVIDKLLSLPPNTEPSQSLLRLISERPAKDPAASVSTETIEPLPPVTEPEPQQSASPPPPELVFFSKRQQTTPPSVVCAWRKPENKLEVLRTHKDFEQKVVDGIHLLLERGRYRMAIDDSPRDGYRYYGYFIDTSKKGPAA